MVLSWIWSIGIFFLCVKQRFSFQNITYITRYVLRSLNFYPYPVHHVFSFWERLTNNNLQATFSHLSLFVNEFLLEHLFFCLCIVYVFFCAKMAELSSYDKDYMACKNWNIYYLSLYWKKFTDLWYHFYHFLAFSCLKKKMKANMLIYLTFTLLLRKR